MEAIGPAGRAAASRPPSELQVDWLQHHLSKSPNVIECPLQHTFTPGLYSRTIFMPAGTLIVSRVHKTEHPFVITKGHAVVWCSETGVRELIAPFIGVTKPGTRRVLFIRKDCTWTTFHPTKETDLDKLQAELTETPNVDYINDMPEMPAEFKALIEGKV